MVIAVATAQMQTNFSAAMVGCTTEWLGAGTGLVAHAAMAKTVIVQQEIVVATTTFPITTSAVMARRLQGYGGARTQMVHNAAMVWTIIVNQKSVVATTHIRMNTSAARALTFGFTKALHGARCHRTATVRMASMGCALAIKNVGATSHLRLDLLAALIMSHSWELRPALLHQLSPRILMLQSPKHRF